MVERKIQPSSEYCIVLICYISVVVEYLLKHGQFGAVYAAATSFL